MQQFDRSQDEQQPRLVSWRHTWSAGVAVQSTVTMSGVPLVPPPPGKSVTAWPLANVVVRVLSVMTPNALVAVHCTCNHKSHIL